jgi:DnaJ family protein A protein 2
MRILLLLTILSSTACRDSFFGGFFGGDGGSPGRGSSVDNTALYETLGVSTEASAAQLKRAYRKAALKHHPDKGGSPDKFKRAAEAFSILSDPQKRQLYDRYGMDGVAQESGAGAGGMGAAGGPSAEDLFSMFFGGGGSGMMGGRGQSREAADTVVGLDVGLEELFAGAEKRLQLQRTRVCAACDGKGGKDGKEGRTCKTCAGRGVVLQVRQLGAGILQQIPAECPDCRGEGRVLDAADRCPSCQGARVTRETATVHARIEPGMRQGDQIVLRGEGNEAPGLRAGDVVLVLRERPHPTYQRQGADLVAQLSINLKEALLGFEKGLERLDGRTLRVRVPRGRLTKPGAIKRVPGEGFPVRGAVGGMRGDLYLRVQVELPTAQTLGEERLRALEQLLSEVEEQPEGEAESTERAHEGEGGQGGVGADDGETGALLRDLEDVQLGGES